MAVPLLPEPDWLDRCVTLLDASFADGGWFQPHCLVSVEPGTDRDDDDRPLVDLGFRPLDEGQHPMEVLLGFRAPKSWRGIGSVCFGWAAPGDVDAKRHVVSGGRPSRHPDRQRVRVTCLVGRDGVERCTATMEDGSVIDEPGTGTVNDALRRCLDLATEPPPVPTTEVFAACWLEEIAAARRPLSWTEIADRHPSMRMLSGAGHRPQPEELIGAGRAMARAVDWKQLRLRVAAGAEIGVDIRPEVADWMDEGMFARWVLAGLVPLPHLLAMCAEHLDPPVLRRVRRTLRSWNLDPPLAARVA